MNRINGLILLTFASLNIFGTAQTISIGQGVDIGVENLNVCVKGTRKANVLAQTFDSDLFLPDFSQSLATCDATICPSPVVGQERPFLVRRTFRLDHAAGHEVLQNPAWISKELGDAFGDNPTCFRDICGKNFVSSIHRGGKLHILLTASFKTNEERKVFLEETQFDLGSLYTIPSQMGQRIDSNGVLSIELNQAGGDAAALSLIIGKDAQLLCALSAADGCLRTIRIISEYAGQSFPNGIDILFGREEIDQLIGLNYTAGSYAVVR